MQTDLGSRLDVGEVGLEVQEQGQFGPLAQVSGGGAPTGQEASLDEEFARETGLVVGQGAGQGCCPGVKGRGVSFHDRILRANPTTATLQLLVPRTTKLEATQRGLPRTPPMSRLDELKREITDLHRRLSCRPTLIDLVEAGRKVVEMKALVPHGPWGPTLREMGLDVRCAQLYAFAYRRRRAPTGRG